MGSVRAQNGAFRFGGWGLLLLFLFTSTPLGPGLTALLGATDPCHQVCIGGGEQNLRVVLHHRCSGVPHHHGLIARVLTGFALAPSAANPDHVIQFHGSDALSKQAQLTPPVTSAVHLLDCVLSEAPMAQVSERFVFFVSSLPPPGDGGRRACLSSTVLLI